VGKEQEGKGIGMIQNCYTILQNSLKKGKLKTTVLLYLHAGKHRKQQVNEVGG